MILRPLQLSDVSERYLSWLGDNEVMQGIATGGYTMEKLRAYVGEKISDPNVAFYAVCDKETGLHIGNAKLDFMDVNARVAEFGLLLGDKNYWGRGIGKEATRLLMSYGFGRMELRKIWLAVYENNPNAKRLYESVGFILEGTLRKHVAVNGQYYDKHLMGLFPGELK